MLYLERGVGGVLCNQPRYFLLFSAGGDSLRTTYYELYCKRSSQAPRLQREWEGSEITYDLTLIFVNSEFIVVNYDDIISNCSKLQSLGGVRFYSVIQIRASIQHFFSCSIKKLNSHFFCCSIKKCYSEKCNSVKD